MNTYTVLPKELQSKLHRLAQMALAFSSHCSADKHCDNTTAKHSEQAAQKVMFNLRSSSGVNVGHFLEAVEILVVFASKNQTAETMQMNRALLTSTDISMLMTEFRGEDYGANFNYDPEMVAGKAWRHGRLAIQGDILGRKNITTWKAKTIFEGSIGKPWPGGKVKYCFANDVSPKVQGVFRAAVEQYTKAVPCLDFQEVAWTNGTSDWLSDATPESHMCAESPAIFVTSDPTLGCFSHIGLMDDQPSQQLQLNEFGCSMLGSVMHELGHALGLVHEHPRSMGKYFFQDRVPKGRMATFRDPPDSISYWRRLHTATDQIEPPDLLKQTSVEYSPLSMMHLDPYAFSKALAKDGKQSDLKPVLVDADLHLNGQRVALARADVSRLIAIYKSEGCGTTSLLQRIGCINGISEQEESVCALVGSSLQWCTLEDFAHCCACGGGVAIQCFQGDSCPKRELVPTYILHWREEVWFLLAVCAVVTFRMSPLAFQQAVYSAILFVATLPLPILITVGDRLSKLDVPKFSRQTDREAHRATFGVLRGDHPHDAQAASQATSHAAPQVGCMGWCGADEREQGSNDHMKEKQQEPYSNVLSSWITGTSASGFNYTEAQQRSTKQPPTRLTNDAFERFKGSFAPHAGGFSSGRDAPSAAAITGDSVGEGPAWCQAFIEASEAPQVHRMYASDSSEPESHQKKPADPFETFTQAMGFHRPDSQEDESSASDGERSKRAK
jgi:hypothetical protein